MKHAFENYQLPEKQGPAYHWQEKALEYIDYLSNPVKSQVFKWAKTKPEKAEATIRYMKEKGITNFNYFAALLSRK